VVTAFADAANPSASTANNRTAASFFMDFLLGKSKWFFADRWDAIGEGKQAKLAK
jgi:hypothetical protein